MNKKCISCGTCVAIAPKDFNIDDIVENGKSIGSFCKANPDLRILNDDVADAISACPVHAIEVHLFKCHHPHVTRQWLLKAIKRVKEKIWVVNSGAVRFNKENSKFTAMKIYNTLIKESEDILKNNYLEES